MNPSQYYSEHFFSKSKVSFCPTLKSMLLKQTLDSETKGFKILEFLLPG